MIEDQWPLAWPGIVESVTTTHQPDGSWAVAALGIRQAAGSATARTWGDTRTRRNLDRTRGGYVQLVEDPVAFARAALERWARDEPVLAEAAAWIEVEATRIDSGRERGTAWVDWSLRPRRYEIRERTVPVPNRASGAVIEMTVAASRLDVPGTHPERLADRFERAASVARRCGGPAEREAVRRIERLVDQRGGFASREGGPE